MLPSLHDDFLVSYEVNCETRQIKLRAKRDPRFPAANGERENHTIVFNGVEGYQFENDNFGNIIFSLEVVPVERVLAIYGSQMQPLTAWRVPRIRGRLISRPLRKCLPQKVCRASF